MRKSAARREADAEEGITEAVRMANEVKRVEVQLKEAHEVGRPHFPLGHTSLPSPLTIPLSSQRFAEERLAASKIQLEWALEKEKEEQARASATIGEVEKQKDELRRTLEKVMEEVASWKAKSEAAMESNAAATAEKKEAIAMQKEAEAAAEAARAATEVAEKGRQQAADGRSRSEVAALTLMSSIGDVEAEAAKAKADIHSVIDERLRAEERSAVAVKEMRLAVEAQGKAEKERDVAAEDVNEQKRQRAREVAKAANFAKREAVKEATVESSKEMEKLQEVHSTRAR